MSFDEGSPIRLALARIRMIVDEKKIVSVEDSNNFTTMRENFGIDGRKPNSAAKSAPKIWLKIPGGALQLFRFSRTRV